MSKVFISYSHDSDAHRERILALSNRLRGDGVDSWIDQYEPAPPEGWPRKMDRGIREADFVLMVCTETYLKRLQLEEEEGKGLGVAWEGSFLGTAKAQLNLGEQFLALGFLSSASDALAKAVDFIIQGYDESWFMIIVATYANILHQFGETKKAIDLFENAENLQGQQKAESQLLYSLRGYQYSDLLLTLGKTDEVLRRSKTLRKSRSQDDSLLDWALQDISTAKAFLQKDHLELSEKWCRIALDSLQIAGYSEFYASGKLVAAILLRKLCKYILAKNALEEAYEIADPSGMRLHLTDYHLEMARLILAIEADPIQYSEAPQTENKEPSPQK